MRRPTESDQVVADEPTEEKVGFLNNLTEEERQALEDKKARAAMAVLAARERANAAKAKEEFAVKKSEWKKKRMYVKGSKVCEANRIYEQGGWFICEVCDKRLQDIPWVEEHVATAKHQRNMEWYATHPLPTTADDFHTPSVAIPACVEWVESEEIYLCTLCNAKAACDAVLQAHLGGKEHAKRVANADWYQTTSGPSDVLPPYCEADPIEGYTICRFCEKKMNGRDMLEVHLGGKDHLKKCCNIGIPAYGEPGHMDAARKYVNAYGFDTWCRQSHWPTFIEDQANCWACTGCCKKFLVPSSVNEHLLEKHPHGDKGDPSWVMVGEPKRKAPMVDSSLARGATEIVRTKAPTVMASFEGAFVCELCHLPFATKEQLRIHEQKDSSHQLVLKRLEEISDPLITFEDI